jgi:hydrogenase maturation protein HypF
MSKKIKKLTEFFVTGLVQGVGFRPYIYAECKKKNICGFVQNTGGGVRIVADNESALLDILLHLPLPMRVDSVKKNSTTGTYDDFSIKESKTEDRAYAEIPPDFFCCPDCARDLMESGNRREGYFFTTCTLCGPRFSIVTKSPFDRKETSMRDFPLCAECKKEYTNPLNRRHHAQTIACKNCGPSLALYENGIPVVCKSDDETIARVASALRQGAIVAVKGIGGFHLVGAMEDKSLSALHDLRNRNNKPFALLCRDIKMARTIAEIGDDEEKELTSVARPIVILNKKAGAAVPTILSELSSVGIMLPYSPLHFLLFAHYDKPLVVTSSNLYGEPITTTKHEQFVPLVLDHNRAIENSVDDSVLKVVAGHPLLIRRSRGFVPRSIAIPVRESEEILALGAEMNNTFALAKGGRMIMSQHMGSIANPVALANMKDTVEKFLAYTNVAPTVILRDLHPDYQSSLFGVELAQKLKIPIMGIQHHKAHVYAAAHEHALRDFVGIACDGNGLGDDGTLWGGEVFRRDVRIGHLELQSQIGGDSATRFPHRMLYGILRKFLSPHEVEKFMDKKFTESARHIVEQQLREGFHTPQTSSTGRIFDAASALLGFTSERTYDGRPALLLESHATTPYDFSPVIKDNILYTTPLFEFLIANIDKDKARLAATVQQYIAEGLYCIALKEKLPIVFAGGCAYNRLMSTWMSEHGVLFNKEIPPGDGGISAGQIAAYVALANARDNIS